MSEEAKGKEVTLHEIALRLSGLLHGSLGGQLRKRSALAAELRAIADWVDGGTKPEAPAREEVTTQQERDVFEYWQRAFGKPRAQFGADRRRVVRARLREGYSVADIKRAIDGCKASGFHTGENDSGREYNDLTLICRNSSKLEGFRDLGASAVRAPAHDGGHQPDAVVRRIEELTREGQQALQEGNINAYNRAQREIEKIRTGGRHDAPSENGDGGGSRRAAAGGG